MANCIIITGGIENANASIQRSIGSYRLASSLQEYGYSCFVLDFITKFSNEEIKHILDSQIDSETLWVGFSSTFFWKNNSSSFNSSNKDRMYYKEYSQVEDILKYIKSKDVKILYGGWKTPYFLADELIDYYVLGHADNSIRVITDHIKYGTELPIQNIENDGEQRSVIDSENFPEPKMIDLNTNWKPHNILQAEGLPIELARGCIFKCKFCNYSLLGKKKGTYLRDSAKIRDEMISNWESFGTTNYYITDDTFNDDNDKIEELHKIFTSLPFKPKFSSYLRIDLINKYPHQADLLTDMGLIGTYFGLETMQYESAKCIGKGLHPNKVRDRLEWLHEKWNKRVNVAAGFILGLPYDTTSYFDELFKWCYDTNTIQNIAFYPLFLFQRKKTHPLKTYASEFSINAEIYGYTFDSHDKMNWDLKEQNLSYTQCKTLADTFNSYMLPKTKVSEFQMISYMNIGVALEDLFNLTLDEIHTKYDIQHMNEVKFKQYKNLIMKETI